MVGRCSPRACFGASFGKLRSLGDCFNASAFCWKIVHHTCIRVLSPFVATTHAPASRSHIQAQAGHAHTGAIHARAPTHGTRHMHIFASRPRSLSAAARLRRGHLCGDAVTCEHSTDVVADTATLRILSPSAPSVGASAGIAAIRRHGDCLRPSGAAVGSPFGAEQKFTACFGFWEAALRWCGRQGGLELRPALDNFGEGGGTSDWLTRRRDVHARVFALVGIVGRSHPSGWSTARRSTAV